MIPDIPMDSDLLAIMNEHSPFNHMLQIPYDKLNFHNVNPVRKFSIDPLEVIELGKQRQVFIEIREFHSKSFIANPVDPGIVGEIKDLLAKRILDRHNFLLKLFYFR